MIRRRSIEGQSASQRSHTKRSNRQSKHRHQTKRQERTAFRTPYGISLLRYRQYSTPSLEFTTRAYGLVPTQHTSRNRLQWYYVRLVSVITSLRSPTDQLHSLTHSANSLRQLLHEVLATRWKPTNYSRIHILEEEKDLSGSCHSANHRPGAESMGQ